jgi:hypothetical protein
MFERQEKTIVCERWLRKAHLKPARRGFTTKHRERPEPARKLCLFRRYMPQLQG